MWLVLLVGHPGAKKRSVNYKNKKSNWKKRLTEKQKHRLDQQNEMEKDSNE